MTIDLDPSWGLIYLCVQVLGFVTAANAVMRVRTSQGAIAWVVSLITFPLLAVPLYWVFGRNRFRGYRAAIAGAIECSASARGVDDAKAFLAPYTHEVEDDFQAIDRLHDFPFVGGNRVDLLIDGEATFDAILEAIEGARDYVLVEFYTIRDDGLGRRLHEALVRKARAGVGVHVLYDELGSHGLGGKFVGKLREAGAEVSEFHTTKGPANRFQLNFRNHRKIVVVDGEIAFVGGHNVGDEYLGLDPAFGPWRDTHVRIAGPAALECQAAFLIDWCWAMDGVPKVRWKDVPAYEDGIPVKILPTGPVPGFDTCSLFFHSLINRARTRLWISSPYFVPDEGIQQALHLAALRGVDVRILVPMRGDHLMIYFAAFAYFEELGAGGVRFFRYSEGFLHQKAALVDDRMAVVGTANLDNRSLRLNFEISALTPDPGFVAQVAEMLEADFTRSIEIDPTDLESRRLPFRIAVRTCRLLAPIL